MRKILLSLLLLSGYLTYSQTSPLDYNGALKVVGTHLCNQDSVPIQLRGMSTHGISWYPHCLNQESIKALRDEWGGDILRIANYVTDAGAYNSDPTKFRNLIDELVDICGNLGVYCIIDWHILKPGDPNYVGYSGAKDFFTYMASKHGKKPHVLFEICNEPNSVGLNATTYMITWDSIRRYAIPVIDEIRKYSDNIIIVGTPNWSQNIDRAAAKPIDGKNIMYTFHFYVESHSSLKNTLKMNVSRLPVFVTEWGTCKSDGGGNFNETESNSWLKLLNDSMVSWCNWSFSDKSETASALISNSCTNGNWVSTSMSGTFIRSKMITPDNWIPIGNKPYIKSAETNSLGDSVIIKTSISLANVTAQRLNDFAVYANDIAVSLSSIGLTNNDSDIVIVVQNKLSMYDNVKVSYTGTLITGSDSTLMQFEKRKVANNINTFKMYGYVEDFNDTVVKGWSSASPSDFILKESNSDLQITGNYASATSDLYRPLVFALPASLDIAANKIVTVKVKSTSALTFRIDLQDINGNTTNTNPLTNTISSDGNFAVYTFDFTSKFSLADSTSISKVLLYANPGQSFEGSFTIDDLTIGVEPTRVSDFTIEPNPITLYLGQSQKIICSFVPLNASNKQLTFTNAKPSIATITNDGIVTSVAVGSTTITVASIDNPAVTKSVLVKVMGVELFVNMLKWYIDKATAILDTATIGDGVGQYPQTAYNAFKTKLDYAVSVLNNPLNQSIINQAESGLNSGINTFLASYNKPSSNIDNVIGSELSVSPIPFSEKVTITSSEIIESIQCVTSLGQTSLFTKVGKQEFEVDSRSFVSGNYFVIAVLSSGKVKVVSAVKQ